MTTATPIYDSATNTYVIEVKSIAELIKLYGPYKDMLKKLLGKDLKITATVKVDVKGREYTSSDSVKIRLALFTIDEVSVKYVEDGNFKGIYNQPYELRGYISKATYDTEYDNAANDYVISNAIRLYSEQLSKAEMGSFYYYSDGHRIELTDEPNQKSDFWIERQGEYYVIKNNMRYPTSTLELLISVEYTSYQYSQYGIVINPRSYTSRDFMRDRNCPFGLDFTRLSNDEYPEPIFTQAELGRRRILHIAK